uniref:ATPase AAA-type core domain-containing protein n=1 Tax=Branchiostoma floridae TaxID=7739 RepID=C3ZB08_BRAFL|eukprot:XP_002594034.1 hypothetical protein BRAFLDRAFT_68526 [Branchiostoma floridae]
MKTAWAMMMEKEDQFVDNKDGASDDPEPCGHGSISPQNMDDNKRLCCPDSISRQKTSISSKGQIWVYDNDFASDEEWLLPRNNEVQLVERLPSASHRPQLVAPKIDRLELAEFETGLSALWQTGSMTSRIAAIPLIPTDKPHDAVMDTELSAALEEAKAEAPRAVGSLISLGEVFSREEEQALLSKIEKRLAAIFPPGTQNYTGLCSAVGVYKEVLYPDGQAIALKLAKQLKATNSRLQKTTEQSHGQSHSSTLVNFGQVQKDQQAVAISCGPGSRQHPHLGKLFDRFLYKIGIVSKEQPVIVQKGDLTSKWVGHTSEVTRKKILISQFVGHTSEVTRKKINASKGGVLLVDEAYRLAQANSSLKDVGREALEELMSVMESGDPIMIFAGYPVEMASFLDVNHGALATQQQHNNPPAPRPRFTNTSPSQQQENDSLAASQVPGTCLYCKSLTKSYDKVRTARFKPQMKEFMTNVFLVIGQDDTCPPAIKVIGQDDTCLPTIKVNGRESVETTPAQQPLS